jgi:hypothetical protein
VEHLIDVYLIKGHFVPWTEGLELVGKINKIDRSRLPATVKWMRIRPLRARLVVYYENRFGKKYVE